MGTQLDWRAGFLEVLRSASDGAKKEKLWTPTGNISCSPEGNLHRLSFEFCELEDKEANLPEATNPGGSCSCTVGLVLLGL